MPTSSSIFHEEQGQKTFKKKKKKIEVTNEYNQTQNQGKK